MKNTLKICSLAAFISLMASPDLAHAQFDYCTLSDKRFDLHIFGASYNSADGRRKLAKGLDTLYKTFSIGDDIRWIVHSSSGMKTYQKCVPGCPEKSMLKKLVDSTCSDQIAKRDKVQFNNTYAKSFNAALAKSGENYDVIADLKTISEYYEGRDEDGTEAYVFHTTIPHGASTDDPNSFNAPFVKAVQNTILSTVTLPNVYFVNANRSEEVTKFWSDLTLNGDSTGINIEFDHLVLD